MNTRNRSRKHFTIAHFVTEHKTQHINISKVIVLFYFILWNISGFCQYKLVSRQFKRKYPNAFFSHFPLSIKPNFLFTLWLTVCVISLFKQLFHYSMHFYLVFFGYFSPSDVQKFWFAFWDENILRRFILKMQMISIHCKLKCNKIMNWIFKTYHFTKEIQVKLF